jgi:hypothetical protein
MVRPYLNFTRHCIFQLEDVEDRVYGSTGRKLEFAWDGTNFLKNLVRAKIFKRQLMIRSVGQERFHVRLKLQDSGILDRPH